MGKATAPLTWRGGEQAMGNGNGAQGRNRTTDTAIFSRMLYQLSYLGTQAFPGRPGLGRGGRR